jgi:tungstate transport system substrate-binding protein
MFRSRFLPPLMVGLGGATQPSPEPASGARTLALASTTSTQDSGLLDLLVPAFTGATRIQVKRLAVGSGEALDLGARGEADVLLVHSPAAEEEFVAEGGGIERRPVMHNDFVLVGPASDPARVKGLGAVAAFEKIALMEASFLSRGDQSGTHMKEVDLWRKAGIEPEGQSWYLTSGEGMGDSLRIAAEVQAYTLVDRGTYLGLGAPPDLPIVSENSEDLLNPYHVILVNPEKHAHVRADEGRRFIEWIVGPEARRLIADFGRAQHGRSLFVPDAS